jgi:GGDEF domain-containing protein
MVESSKNKEENGKKPAEEIKDLINEYSAVLTGPERVTAERVAGRIIMHAEATAEAGSAELSEAVEDATESIHDKASKYFDQRRIFRQTEGRNKVLNKSGVLRKISEELSAGNKNMLRMSIDIEGLKTVNDLAGHQEGDRYLKAVYGCIKEATERIEQEIRGAYPELEESIKLIVSAEGGDEFGVLVIGPEGCDFDNICAKPLGPESMSDLNLDQYFSYIMNESLGDAEELKNLIKPELIKGKILKLQDEFYKDKLTELDKKLAGEKSEKAIEYAKNDLIGEKILMQSVRELRLSRGDGRPLPERFSELDASEQKEAVRFAVENLYKEKQKQKDEIMKEYEFFASASCGASRISEITAEEVQQIMREKNIASEERAILDSFITKADERMNGNKKAFKTQLRNMGELGMNENELRDAGLENAPQRKDLLWMRSEGGKMAAHMDVLARNEEAISRELEFEELEFVVDNLKSERARLRASQEKLELELEKTKESLVACEGSK